MSSLIGQTVGRYQVLEQLGEGGMATVYKAYDTRLEADVAVKVIRTEQVSPNILAKAMTRFEREAKALARLNHPNIVKVIDYGEFEGKPYLVMPYLPAGTLKDRLKELNAPMPWQEAARLLIPIARALDYAHSENMIHRDVKPSNILITRTGDPVLTDFGIAKILDEESTVDLTGTSATVGTPEYMAPEQATSKTVDQRSDIYALGIVMYEMVTGRKPFTADTPLAVLFKHASEPLPRPMNLVPGLPDVVEKVLLKALAKNPNERYQGMGEFAVALERIAGSTPTADVLPSRPPTRDSIQTQTSDFVQPDPRPSTSKPSQQRGLITVVLISSFVLLLLFTSGIFFTMRNKQQHATETAQAQATGTRLAQFTETAQAYETEIARVRATETVQAQQTATIQAILTSEAIARITQAALETQQAYEFQLTQAAIAAQATANAISLCRQSIDLPVDPGWQVMACDMFGSDLGFWPTGTNDDSYFTGSRYISGGKYHWDLTSNVGFTYRSTPFSPSGDFLANVTVDMTGRIVSVVAGIMFRDIGTERYFFYISPREQLFHMMYTDGGTWDPIRSATSSYINAGSPNQLTVLANGTSYTLYINGRQVYQFQDDRITYGNVGVGIGVGNPGEYSTFQFDDFLLLVP